MYEAEGDKVYVRVPPGGRFPDNRELFLTVHPTDTGGFTTVAEQAQVIANILNKYAG